VKRFDELASGVHGAPVEVVERRKKENLRV
jgi:hypothetical protein